MLRLLPVTIMLGPPEFYVIVIEVSRVGKLLTIEMIDP
jgi:hypothetical protein